AIRGRLLQSPAADLLLRRGVERDATADATAPSDLAATAAQPTAGAQAASPRASASADLASTDSAAPATPSAWRDAVTPPSSAPGCSRLPASPSASPRPGRTIRLSS